MSDKKGSVEEQANSPEGDKKAVKSTKASLEKERGSRKGSPFIAWLAFLLVLLLAGALAWVGKEALHREAQFEARLITVETSLIREDSVLDDFGLQWQKKLAVETSKREDLEVRQEAKLKNIESRLAIQREELSRFGAVDRQDWLLAEAQYLLRLANQRLIMADDVVAAKALLNSADSILKELDDVSLHDVRAAVAADLAAVRAVPKRDIQGMYLALAALIEQADKLVIFQMPEEAENAPVEPAEDWQGRLQQGYEDALLKLSDYIIIRRRDVPVEALMDPQWEGLVRQNLRMLLEQAQVALLSSNQRLFRESLDRARHWLGEFFASDEAAASALAEEITVLQKKDISAEMPNISRSLAAVDAALDQRMRSEGGD